MQTNNVLVLALVVFLCAMVVACITKDPWPMICATIVFLAVYLERAFLDRQELENIMAAQKERITELSKVDHDIEELKTQINGIQLSLGMKPRGK